MNTVVNAKDGFCPTPTAPTTCQNACSQDDECTEALKCCSNGCGLVCVEPTFGKKSRSYKYLLTSCIITIIKNVII